MSHLEKVENSSLVVLRSRYLLSCDWESVNDNPQDKQRMRRSLLLTVSTALCAALALGMPYPVDDWEFYGGKKEFPVFEEVKVINNFYPVLFAILALPFILRRPSTVARASNATLAANGITVIREPVCC
ncbi:hypothetical protein DPMN_098179 [Dreissena polymorpha]|uniref:Uncharacterized protein n=1 Tax=Dreissena polymorpha TaxID=45954 RepID=A0A9D4LD32_DREPO|nr:hypothetical protein DPMN_098179 [Dreissena polymorpha]